MLSPAPPDLTPHAARRPPGLDELKRRLKAAAIPAPRPDNLRLATWNIRELGKSPRWDDSIALLAAIIARFDLVSVVELRDDLGDLRRILHRLGPRWSAVFSDYHLDAGGNRERAGFLFDTTRVSFTGLASSAEAARTRQGDEYALAVPWWRPPFLASFATGSLSFVLVAAHVRWGRTVSGREAEVAALAAWAARRSSERFFQAQDLALVGDFNLPSQRSWVWEKFPPAGFAIPPGLADDPGSNLARGKRYDRVLWRSQSAARRLTDQAGAADFYQGSPRELFPDRELTPQAFTFQLSDHLPLWFEVACG